MPTFLLILLLVFNIDSLRAEGDKIILKNSTVLKKVEFNELHGWSNENFTDALTVLLENCDKINSLPADKNIFPQARTNKKITKTDFYAACKVANVIKNYGVRYKQIFFENFFTPFEVIKKREEKSLFTGYYIPTIRAKTVKDDVFKYPIYRKPEDLSNYEQYYSRKQINNGALNNRNLEIFYTDDPIELFFAHIQGSMTVFLVDEAKFAPLGFDGKNNHKFSSVGRFMVDNDLMEKSDLNAIQLKKKLKSMGNNFLLSILNVNDSYIFFKMLENSGIVGAFGTSLVATRTIAVDNDTIPLGFPLWLNTQHVTKDDRRQLNKLVIANDTGSAIKGSVRGDIFFGYGEIAEEAASYQYSEGKYYILLPERIVRKL
jgi:membrane-bound lytic murein transglycosylase A